MEIELKVGGTVTRNIFGVIISSTKSVLNFIVLSIGLISQFSKNKENYVSCLVFHAIILCTVPRRLNQCINLALYKITNIKQLFLPN